MSGVEPGRSPLTLWQRANLIYSEHGAVGLAAWEASLTEDERVALLAEGDQAMAAFAEGTAAVVAATTELVALMRRVAREFQAAVDAINGVVQDEENARRAADDLRRFGDQ